MAVDSDAELWSPGPGDREHTVTRRKDASGQLFLLYAGHGAGLGGRIDFLRKGRLLDRNLAIFRDTTKTMYQRGIGRSRPNIPSFLEWQIRVARGFGRMAEMYTVGSSAGAYAAILFGYMLRVKAVYAFAPPTLVPARHLIDSTPDRFADLRVLLSASNQRTEYRIFYNESYRSDREYVERIEGLPGVVLHPQDGRGHLVLQHMLDNDTIGDFMPPFVPAEPRPTS